MRRPVVILNGKLRAVVQAAQTHRALLFPPHQTLVLHTDGMHGALFGTQSAPDTRVVGMQMLGLAFGIIQGISAQGYRCGDSTGNMATPCPPLYERKQVRHLLFGASHTVRHSLRVGQIKQRRPYIGHTHPERRVQRVPFVSPQESVRLPRNLPRRGAVGGYQKAVRGTWNVALQILQPLAHDSGQSPVMRGYHPTEHLALAQSELRRCIRYRLATFPDGCCNLLCHILRVPRCRKVVNHCRFCLPVCAVVHTIIMPHCK